MYLHQFGIPDISTNRQRITLVGAAAILAHQQRQVAGAGPQLNADDAADRRGRDPEPDHQERDAAIR